MSKFNPSQVEELKLIGSHLCQQRESRSLTLEEVSAVTFVRLPLLEAIEAGEVERLPEVIYVQGFIRRYGDCLGLDGNALAHQLTRTPLFTPDDLTPELVALPLAPEAPESLSSVPRDQTSKVPSRKLRSESPILLKENEPQRSFLARWSPYWLYPLVLLAAIAGLYSLLNRPTPQSTSSSTASVKNSEPGTAPAIAPIVPVNPADSSATPLPSQSGKEPASSSPPAPGTSATTATPLKAKVELTDEAWLQVEADGKKVYEGVLSKGAVQTWTASKTLKIRSGNAGAVNLSVNQAAAKPLGTLGEVKEVVLNSQS